MLTDELDAVRRDLQWGDRFVALYAGAHGRANGLEQLLDAAECLRSRTDILIASERREKLPLEAAIVTTEMEHLDLVPSKLRFARFEKEPAIAINRLRSKLAPLSTTCMIYSSPHTASVCPVG